MNLRIDQAGDSTAVVRAEGRYDGVNPPTMVEFSVVEIIGPSGVPQYRLEVRAGSSLRNWEDDDAEDAPRTLFVELYHEGSE